MENLFLSVMDTDFVNKIDETKANKEFCLELLKDLSRVFQINHVVYNNENSVEIRMRTSPSHNWYNCYSFIADSNGIRFMATLLTYEDRISDIFKRYANNKGTKKLGSSNHETFGIEIDLKKSDFYLPEKLKDIVKLMELKRFYKQF